MSDKMRIPFSMFKTIVREMNPDDPLSSAEIDFTSAGGNRVVFTRKEVNGFDGSTTVVIDIEINPGD